jgi:transcriptional regulator with XRE-family HTH domain
MTDKKKQVEIPAPQLGDVAAELARARANAGLSHSDLHRITGISRTVLIGYEAGRTKPGTREIRLLCDALKVSPNRLIYGSDEFSLFSDIESGTDRAVSTKFSMLMLMLSKEERLALLTLARSILVARHGKQVLESAVSALLTVGDVVNALDGGYEWSIEELEEFKRTIEDEIAKSSLKPK